MKAVRFITFVAILALAAVFAFGQAETGLISGTVTDPSGAVVSGATVTAKSLSTQASRSVTTNSNGLYTISNLPPGQYELAVTAPNFGAFRQNVIVNVGSRNEISPRLEVAATGTTVEVVAGGGGTQVETQSSELSQVVSAEQVNSLPSLTRNPYDFVGSQRRHQIRHQQFPRHSL